MINGRISKREFVQAYQCLYGTTKAEAEYIFSISSYDYKLSVKDCYANQCKKSFYHD